MKLQKAIEIGKELRRSGYRVPLQPQYDALQLLIEAGKRLLELRGYSMTPVDTRLPGETEE